MIRFPSSTAVVLLGIAALTAAVWRAHHGTCPGQGIAKKSTDQLEKRRALGHVGRNTLRPHHDSDR